MEYDMNGRKLIHRTRWGAQSNEVILHITKTSAQWINVRWISVEEEKPPIKSHNNTCIRMRIRTAQGTIVQVLQELSPSNRSRLESLYIFAFITSARTPTGILCGGIFYAASWHFAKIRIYSTYLQFWVVLSSVDTILEFYTILEFR